MRVIQQETIVESPKVAVDEKPYFLSYKTANYFLGVIETMLGLRLIFQLTAANPRAGFVRFVYDFSEFLMLPFRLIFPTTSTGVIRLEWSVIAAMVIYALIVYGIMHFIDLMRTADTSKV